MAIKRCELIIMIIQMIFFLFNLFSIKFTILTTKALEVLFFICISFIILCYMFIIFLFFSDKIKCLKKIREKLKRKVILMIIVFIFFEIFEFIVFTINLAKYSNYWRNCPFTLSSLEYKEHYSRRCELYNTNNNSRYMYQYICSYNPTQEFINAKKNKKNSQNKLSEEIKSETIICIPLKNIIPDNEVVILFNNEYSKNKNFYCSRTDRPNNFTFAKPKDCNKITYAFMLIFYLISLFQIYVIIIYLKIQRMIDNYERRRILHNFRARHLNERRNLEAIEVRNLINFGRLLNLIRGMINININMASSSNCSTEVSEKPHNIGNNELGGGTRNIIIENNKIYTIETDINNYSPDKKEKENNSINIEEIKVNFDINSEEIKLPNQINNNINNQ